MMRWPHEDMVCPACGCDRLMFPVDGNGDVVRPTSEQDGNDPYCPDCEEHVLPEGWVEEE